MSNPTRSLGDAATHQILFNKMADLRGVDMARARADGHVTEADLAGLLTRCRGCSDAAGCAHALGRNTLPASCANDDTWATLQKIGQA
jgi:hypothetical protein